MSRRRRDGMPIGVLIALVAVAALLCAALFIVMYLDKNGKPGSSEDGADTEGIEAGMEDLEGSDSGTVTAQGGSAVTVINGDEAGNIADIPIPDDKKVDITSLKSKNPDIYAWLYIPEAGIDEPILQSDEDMNYYSFHNADGQEDDNGAVFTQMLNSKDFSDNLTVIYGRNSGDDKGFSNLKVFSDPTYFEKYPYIYIYTENGLLIYQTFAAYESDDKLIIMFYGTQYDDLYSIYLSNIEEYAGLGGRLDKSAWPNTEDKMITLSTGVTGKDDRRFLVQAKLVETLTNN